MPTFQYEAMDQKTGKDVTDVIEAATEEEALDEPARLFRAKLAAEAKERQKAHLARWSARPA